MSRVFFTSDLHLGHKNLCEGLRHMTVEENDELIIHNWNSVVNKKDTVYILGDITNEKHKLLKLYIPKFYGNIINVGGNHDTYRCAKALMELKIPVMGALSYKGFMCTHIPIHPYFLNECRGNIHGHIHKQNIMTEDGKSYPKLNEPKYINVNCELHNFTPVLFTDLEEKFMANRF